MRVYERIKAMLKERKLKMSDLETAIGCSVGYISRVENWDSLNFGFIKKIANFFDMSVSDLFGGEDREDSAND